jgi:hypothetical protein
MGTVKRERPTIELRSATQHPCHTIACGTDVKSASTGGNVATWLLFKLVWHMLMHAIDKPSALPCWSLQHRLPLFPT